MSVRDLVAFNVPYYRSREDMSQGELANKCGCTTAHIRNIEKGKSFPSPDMLDKLVDALNVEAYELFCPIPGDWHDAYESEDT